MATCGHCAEELGLRQLLLGEACEVCRMPLARSSSGRVRGWAEAHGDRLLASARPRRAWLLFAAGVVLTAAVSLVPSWGALTSTLVPLIQLVIIERNVGRYVRHLGALHAITFDFYSGIGLLGAAVIEGLAGLLLPVATPIITIPIFIAAWFGAEGYARAHLRAEARGQLPSVAELAGLALAAGVVMVPPLVVLAAALISLIGGRSA